MGESTERSRLERIAQVLRSHGVEFVVIGGEAATLHGSPLATFDTDLCYRRSPENLKRLADALRELHVGLRGAPPGLPFRIDAASLGLGCNFTFTTDLGDLDLLGEVEPLGGFEAVEGRAETMDLDGLPVRVIALDDLIRVKEHIKRPKDQAALYQLLAIRNERDGTPRT
jgi:hypothetical protein